MRPVDLVVYDGKRLEMTAEQIHSEGGFRKLRLECEKWGLSIKYDMVLHIAVVSRS